MYFFPDEVFMWWIFWRQECFFPSVVCCLGGSALGRGPRENSRTWWASSFPAGHLCLGQSGDQQRTSAPEAQPESMTTLGTLLDLIPRWGPWERAPSISGAWRRGRASHVGINKFSISKQPVRYSPQFPYECQRTTSHCWTSRGGRRVLLPT